MVARRAARRVGYTLPMTDASVVELAERALDVARAAGASYADARYLAEDWESIDVQDSRVQGVDRGVTAGIGIRVIADGAWGFAGTARLEPGEVERAARLAVEIARSSRPLRRAPIRLADEDPVRASWSSPMDEDPFAVPLEGKIDLLLSCTKAMKEVDALTLAEASMDLWRRSSFFASSEGARIDQVITQNGAGIRAIAVGEREVQQRSFPNSFRGHFAARGYEHIRAMDLPKIGRAHV